VLTGVRHLDTTSYQQKENYKLAVTRRSNQFSLYECRQVNAEIYFDISNKFQVTSTIVMDILLFSS